MASAGVNVLRYSALGAGLFYGLYHQASLTAQAKLSAVNREYEHKQSLIDKAKAEYNKKQLAAEKKLESGEAIQDPADPRFDLEAYLKTAGAEAK